MRPTPVAAPRRAEAVALLALVVVLALAAGWCVLRRPTPIADAPLVQAADLAYTGSFPVPSSFPEHGDRDLTFGGQGLSVLPGGGGLLFGCHSPLAVARVSLPAPATLAAPCVWPPGEPGSGSHIGGTLSYHGRLVVSKYVFYDGNGSAWYGHQFSDDDGTTWSPLMRVGALDPAGNHLNVGYTAGYLGETPGEFRAALKAPAFTGQGILSIISRTSSGPAAFGFDPDQLDEGIGGMTTAIPWVYYDLAHPLANPDTQNELFTRSDRLAGGFFVPGTNSFLFVGHHGTGPICYGSGTSNPDEAGTPGSDGMMRCYDPSTGAQGEHAYPYHGQVWAYDVRDFAKVVAKELQPWDVRPYAVWRLPVVPGTDPDNYQVRRGGAAFDPATRRLTVASDFGTSPRLDVWTIATGTTPPPDPPMPTGPCTVAAVTRTPAAVVWTVRCEAAPPRR